MQIPLIGLGTYQLKGQVAYKIVLEALRNGYRLIDTAKLYKNETEIGQAIKDSGIDRKEIFIITKIWIDDIKEGSEKIINSILNSLIKLDTTYIDLILLHAPIEEKLLESWSTLEEINLGNVESLRDKIKYIGVSNYNVDHLSTILNKCRIKPYANQIEITPFLPRNRLVKFCQDENIKIIAHSSLAKKKKFGDYNLNDISKKYNINISALLLLCAKYKNYIILPRTSNVKHLEENIQCLEIELNFDVIKKMDKLDCKFSTHKKYLLDEK